MKKRGVRFTIHTQSGSRAESGSVAAWQRRSLSLSHSHSDNDERRTTNDERRTTNDERRTTNDERRTTNDEEDQCGDDGDDDDDNDDEDKITTTKPRWRDGYDNDGDTHVRVRLGSGESKVYGRRKRLRYLEASRELHSTDRKGEEREQPTTDELGRSMGVRTITGACTQQTRVPQRRPLRREKSENQQMMPVDSSLGFRGREAVFLYVDQARWSPYFPPHTPPAYSI